MTSREKVLALKGWLLSQKPEDEETAQQLQLLASFAPIFVRMLPAESEEVDRYLRLTAAAAARCRSDDAAPIGVFELIGGEWQEVEVFEEVGA